MVLFIHNVKKIKSVTNKIKTLTLSGQCFKYWQSLKVNACDVQLCPQCNVPFCWSPSCRSLSIVAVVEIMNECDSSHGLSSHMHQNDTHSQAQLFPNVSFLRGDHVLNEPLLNVQFISRPPSYFSRHLFAKSAVIWKVKDLFIDLKCSTIFTF